MNSKPSEQAPLALAIAIVVLFALIASIIQYRSNLNDSRERTEALESEFSQLIRQRFMLYQHGLHGARGTVQAGGYRDIKRETFVDYTKSRALADEFPGSRGIGYIEIVPSDQTEAFVARARRDGFPDFAIRELSPNSDTRYVIKYIYPLAGNEGATGLDIGSENNRRTAAWAAIRSGLPQLTAPITLVQASGEVSQGFLLLLPIYDKPDAMPMERVSTAVGWTYSPLVVSEVLKDLGPRRNEIAFSISDASLDGEFYQSPGYQQDSTSISRKISVFGRDWEVNFHTLPDFEATLNQLNPLLLFFLILAAGIAIIVAASSYFRAQKRDRIRSLENEKFAFAIFDAAPQALIAIDPAGTIVRASPYANTLIAGEKGDLEGTSSSKVFSGAILAKLNALGAEKTAASRDVTQDVGQDMDLDVGQDVGQDVGLRSVSKTYRLDGSHFMAAISLSRLTIGNRLSLVVSVTDVTTEHEALEVLSNSQQRWQELANSLPQLVWTCTASGDCDFLSNRWIEYTGRPLEEQKGKKWLEQVHPDDRKQQSEAWIAAESAKSSYTVEYRIQSKDGNYRLFYTRAEPILDSDGNILRWIGSNTDIEDRHQAETRVRELLTAMEDRVDKRTSELKAAVRDLRNIVDVMPSLISYWDAKLNIRFANKAYEDWIGLPEEQLVGRPLAEIMPPDRYAHFLPYTQKAMAGERCQMEDEVEHERYGRRSLQIHYLPDAENGVVHGFYAIVFDVTELKAAEEVQRLARIAAEESTRAKSAFLTSMSHELRTPMNSILGFSDLLCSQHFGDLNDKQMQYVNLIHRSGEHLLKLMDDVLELSKIEAGKVDVSMKPVSVDTVVRSVIASLAPLAVRRNVSVKDKSQATTSFVLADSTKLMQILLNLGTNAVKYNNEGGWVEFSCRELDNGFTRISVQDNGRGIPKDRQSGAFQPFNRLGAEQGEIEGTGVGLALVKNYVELSGGAIGFQSEEGVGSTFWIDLQTATDKIEPIGATAGMTDGTKVHIDYPMKVLYVEDNEINRMLFENYILVAGSIDYFAAREGIEGLEIARRERPDMIFLDINLPGMNGYDILREIRSDPFLKDTKVVAVTANAMEGDAAAGLAAGFDEYLPKPLRNEQLQKLLREQAEFLKQDSAQIG